MLVTFPEKERQVRLTYFYFVKNLQNFNEVVSGYKYCFFNRGNTCSDDRYYHSIYRVVTRPKSFPCLMAAKMSGWTYDGITFYSLAWVTKENIDEYIMRCPLYLREEVLMFKQILEEK